MSKRFAQKSMIVTGAGSGIGRAIAEVFGAEGAEVLVTDVNEEAARQTAEDSEKGVTIKPVIRMR